MKRLQVIVLLTAVAFGVSTDVLMRFYPAESSVAVAGESHEIDFTQALTGINGDELKQCNKSEGDPPKCVELVSMTLGDVALYALIVPSEDEKNLDPKKKFERDRLARRIYKNAHAMLSPEDVALIKERIGKTASVVQVGAAWPLLDPTLKD
jgi:hypothetical protein